jgi:glycosyltransferase involved in cell wall biosynthesis
LYQENRGKHIAHNRGILEARGELFLVLDSDDSCLPQTLVRFKHHWEQISASERTRFVGVTGLCVNLDGDIIGDRFPADVLDSDFIEIVARYGVRGEKWGFHRTDVLREFPFPEIPGERFIAEGLVWNRIARKFKTRFVNEVVRIYHESSDSLTAAATRIRVESPEGARRYYGEYLALRVPLRLIVRNLVNYIRFSLHGGHGSVSIVSESGWRVLASLLFPLGYALFRRDLALLRRGRGARS